MKASIELEAFAAMCKLPNGLRFKEWDNNGCIIAFKPDSERGQFIDSKVAAIERISDGAMSMFEISFLTECSPERGKIFLFAAELVKAVDKAIAELEE